MKPFMDRPRTPGTPPHRRLVQRDGGCPPGEAREAPAGYKGNQ